MGKNFQALLFIFRESFRPFQNIGSAKDVSETVEVVLKWIFPTGLLASGGFVFWVQDKIPGVQNLWEWVFPCIVVGIFYSISLFWTASRLRIQIVDNEEALIPNLHIEVGEQETTGALQGWGFVVHNMGMDEATGLYAELEALAFAHPIQGHSMNRWPVNRLLLWAGQQDADDAFVIPGGQRRRLKVCYKNPITRNIELSYHRTTDEFRDNNALTGFSMAVLALISIVSKGKKPIYALCRINQQQMMHWARKEDFALLYCGGERPDVAQFHE